MFHVKHALNRLNSGIYALRQMTYLRRSASTLNPIIMFICNTIFILKYSYMVQPLKKKFKEYVIQKKGIRIIFYLKNKKIVRYNFGIFNRLWYLRLWNHVICD